VTKRILIVEDQEDNRAIMRDILSSAGYALIEAIDGEEGVKLARSERPDLILMDIQLPILDGYEATRQIRAIDELKSVPIIAVTSYAWSARRRQYRNARATQQQRLPGLGTSARSRGRSCCKLQRCLEACTAELASHRI